MKTQKELKTEYAAELAKVWDTKMVKYCITRTAYIVEHNGRLYGIEKPRIEKKFCFGYGYCGVSVAEEEAAAYSRAEEIRTNEKFFIEKNLEDINRKIKQYKEAREAMNYNWTNGSFPRYAFKCLGSAYWNQPEDCRLDCLSLVDTLRESVEGWVDVELIDKYIAGLEEVKKDFVKRLNSYLKRYGLAKVHSWTYLSD